MKTEKLKTCRKNCKKRSNKNSQIKDANGKLPNKICQKKEAYKNCPLGRVGLVVKKSVCVSPSHAGKKNHATYQKIIKIKIITQPLQICIGPTIRIGRESWCLPYAGFLLLNCINLNMEWLSPIDSLTARNLPDLSKFTTTSGQFRKKYSMRTSTSTSKTNK